MVNIKYLHLGSSWPVTGFMFPTVTLPDPPDALLLATATMSPTQMMVSPAMVATRRPWTLFMILILTHSGWAQLGPMCVTWCQHSPDQSKTCFVSWQIFNDSSSLTHILSINSENQYLPLTVTSGIVQSMSMTDNLLLDYGVSRRVTLVLQKSVSTLWRRLWPDLM